MFQSVTRHVTTMSHASFCALIWDCIMNTQHVTTGNTKGRNTPQDYLSPPKIPTSLQFRDRHLPWGPFTSEFTWTASWSHDMLFPLRWSPPGVISNQNGQTHARSWWANTQQTDTFILVDIGRGLTEDWRWTLNCPAAAQSEMASHFIFASALVSC